MATATKANNIFSKLFAKREKKNKDWARVEEPETFLKGVMFTIFTLIIIGVMGSVTFRIFAAPNGLEYWIASFLVSLHSDLEFNQLYASFALAVMALINFVILVAHLMFGHADNDDIIEMLSDLDANIQERLSEVDHGITEKLDNIERNT